MYDRLQELTKDQINNIHNASMDLLKNAGIVFNEDEALEIFKKNGFKVENKTVFFEEKQVLDAVESSPSKFTIKARNPEYNISIGEDDFVFAPGYGAPFMVDVDRNHRKATMDDYNNFCKLAQSSKYLDMNGWMMVEPSDISDELVHAEMNLSNILLCDKAFLGSPMSKRAARDGVEMAAIAFGGMDQVQDIPVSISLINSLSPLQFSDEMIGSLIELARAGQPCVIASLIMAGASGPVNLDGVLALQNAEILAGVTLAQLINKGTPVVYGSTSSAMDMKSGGLSIGAPTLSKNISFTAQMAHHYNLPSRSGGCLTDALYPDAQAGAESAIALTTAARSGINFILHSCGILGSYIGMSYEKFIIDEEICGMVRKLLQPLEATPESIDVETIKTVGAGGQYLTNPKTFKLCRTEFFNPDLMCRKNYESWQKDGSKTVDQVATEKFAQRMEKYVKPDIDPGIEKDLREYVAKLS